MNHILAVDPSIRACGFALASHGKARENRGFSLTESGVIVSKSDVNRWERIDQITDDLQEMVPESVRSGDQNMVVVVEMPQAMKSAQGQAAANAGDTLILAALVGSIRAAMREYGMVSVECLTVSKWKGNAPKRITQRRIAKRWGEFMDHNEADAVGILDWYVNKRIS